ncbi:Gifsy-1 prophage protein [Edwardsiella piscicida]|nr:hypothetical protein HI13_contig00045-0009 [Edwardsiella piscicida]GBK54731.1 hypothetical protein JFPO13_contig000010-0206 [Edwardsiella piscicida]GBK57243.1 Gifsy-1 prophage protein [Edwardsiella piscicida]
MPRQRKQQRRPRPAANYPAHSSAVSRWDSALLATPAPGEATVTILLPDHRQRVLFFTHGKPLTADLSQADGDMTFTWHQEGDLFLIRAGHERYEVPDAVIRGG